MPSGEVAWVLDDHKLREQHRRAHVRKGDAIHELETRFLFPQRSVGRQRKPVTAGKLRCGSWGCRPATWLGLRRAQALRAASTRRFAQGLTPSVNLKLGAFLLPQRSAQWSRLCPQPQLQLPAFISSGDGRLGMRVMADFIN
jgi:hypothetical protein